MINSDEKMSSPGGEASIAKKVHVYSNGDRFFTGRRFVINPRTTRNYESFLNQVTLSLKPAFGAVRVLRTPENGHPVGDLDDLETGRSYVACAQKFIKLGYEDITLVKQNHSPPERRNKFNVSGRIKKVERHPIAIFVFTNGEPLQPAKRILLKPWVQKTWENVLSSISERVSLRTGAIRHILELTDKTEVNEGVHLKNNEYYVAVGSEKYKDLDYGMQPVVLSPKQQQKRRYPALVPIKKRSGITSSNEQSPLGSSSNSIDSDPKPSKKALTNQQPVKEGIPVKPIKHKRGSLDRSKDPPSKPIVDKKVEDDTSKKEDKKKQSTKRQEPVDKKEKQVDLDKDDGGVYKSKARKQKVAEVKEEKKPKSEVPANRRKAKQVQEDINAQEESEPQYLITPDPKTPSISTSSKSKGAKHRSQTYTHSNKTARGDKIDDEQEKAAIRIQAQYRGYRRRKQLSKQHMKREQKPTATKSSRKKSYTSEEEQAAVKIQAQYRGYKTRKQLKGQKDKKHAKPIRPEISVDQSEAAAIKIQAGYRGYKVRKDLKAENERKEAAAVKIQASYRGYRVRKDSKLKRESSDEARENKAAVTIQANYRGYRARKNLRNGQSTAPGDKGEGDGKSDAGAQESNPNKNETPSSLIDDNEIEYDG